MTGHTTLPDSRRIPTNSPVLVDFNSCIASLCPSPSAKRAFFSQTDPTDKEMSAPSSTSPTQSSSESASFHSLSSRSSLSGALASAFQTKRKRGVNINASVHDQSHDNTWINHGQMNVVYGNNAVQHIQIGLDSGEVLVFSMTRSRNAEFDMVGKVQRETCTPQTCQYILKDLKKWCKERVTQLLFWLNGMPGTGKTTIVYTLCHYLRKRGLLGASFFCSRSVSDCQDVVYIFPTIAFQLAREHPEFRKKLGSILREDPDIPQRPLHVQLQRLIIEPFKTGDNALPSGLVVVLDALDECVGNVASFLQILVQYTAQLPFRLLLTSRPECEIHSALGATSPAPSTRKFVLHEVEKSVVREDIIRFLQSKLSPLPDAATISALADYSGSAFILAATVVRLVMDGIGDPQERLKSILDALESKGTNAITEPLDTLYTEILSRVSKSRGEMFKKEIEGIKDIVFTVICVREPLTSEAIGVLWGLSQSVVVQRLKQLHSVIFVPEDATKPITVFHASFIDYITDKNRSQTWYCDETAFHDKLAAMCFKTMNRQLRQNICELEGEACRPNEEVGQEVVERHIGIGLGYACENWVEHLQRCRSLLGYSSVIQEAHEFVKHHLFHWFECTSLLGCLLICEGALEELEEWLKGSAIVELIREGREFLRLNYDVINYSANETYRSALIWVPVTSSLRSHYASLWKQIRLPRVLRGQATNWTEASRVVKTHAGRINTVAITSDGSRVVFGSENGAMHLWDVLSEKEDQTLTGHTAGIKSVAVSSKGSRIVSASRDFTTRVWELGRPEPITVFQGHSDIVQCVAVSSDGMLVCSCDIRGNIMVWDPLTARVQWSQRTAEPDGRNRSVSFLTNGDCLVSVSGTVIQIWNAKTGTVLRSFKGHDRVVLAIAVSLNDALLITGSVDTTANIWNVSNGKKMHTLRGHSGEVLSVAFFYDGHRAVTGSEDRTIRIWDISTEETLALLTGHTQFVCSVAVFPDDHQVVSGSWDGTLMLWSIPDRPITTARRWAPWAKRVTNETTDVWKGKFMTSSPTGTLFCLYMHEKIYLLSSSTLTQHSTINTGKIFSAAFSSHGSWIAAASNVMTIWEIASGRKLTTMKGHKQGITSIAFSHDDKRVVTGSNDGTAHIWCAATGAEQRVLRHPPMISSVAFSPNDRLIVTTSNSRTSVRLWDSRTGRDLEELEFQSTFRAEYAAFSANGQLLISSPFRMDATLVWNVEDGKLIHSLDSHKDWTCLPNGVSYTTLNSSWICKTTDPAEPPTKLYWIPPRYRPIKDKYDNWKPIAFSSTSGDRIILPSAGGTIILDLSTV